jgi:antitoxin component YwqK of YwqJK toxin-antitoxin module
MKRLLLIVLPLLLIVGCSKQEPINYETTLIERDGVFYTKDTNKPYSGSIFSLDSKGRNKIEGVLENGKLITHKKLEWDDYGQNVYKLSEINYKDGIENGLFTRWYDNGQKEYINTWKDGKEDGLYTSWYYNGQKSHEGTYKDGEFINTIGRWNKDGSVRKELFEWEKD